MTDRRATQLVGASLRPLLPLAVVWAAGSGVLVAMVSQQAIPYEELLLDPNAYSRIPWYTGLISNLGVLGWTAATVTAAGGAWISRQGGRVRAGQYLGGATLFTALLLGDDLFQFHIVVSRALGLPKAAFYALYLVLGAWWLVRNWREARRTRWPLLAAASLALALSVAVDQLASGSSAALAAEDSGKFLGILAWALYFGLTARDIGLSVLQGAGVAAGRTEPPGSAAPEPPPHGLAPDAVGVGAGAGVGVGAGGAP